MDFSNGENVNLPQNLAERWIEALSLSPLPHIHGGPGAT